MSGTASGLYRRLVLLIGGVALLIVFAALLILRSTTGDAATSRFAHNLRAQVVLADVLLAQPSIESRDADTVLSELGFLRRPNAPELHFPHARFWDDVAEELGVLLPGRAVHFESSRSSVMWIHTANGKQEWIGIPVVPLRGEVTRSAVISGVTACLIVLLAAAAYARRLARPLRQLADAAPDIAAGRAVPPLESGVAREFHELEAALNAAADVVRETASDRSLMLAALSHDMRTPLARLRLASELAEMDESAREGMHLDIDELDHLIGQCIDFARDGRDEPVERFDIVAMLLELVVAQQRSGMQWSINAPPLILVSGRPVALRRAVANLMENAVHHGRAPLAIECHVDAGQVLIGVLDRGAGVDPAIIGKLGTPFLQGSPSRESGRSGLGLASALRVAAQHAGSMRFSNREGGGFSAVLSIPTTSPGDS